MDVAASRRATVTVLTKNLVMMIALDLLGVLIAVPLARRRVPPNPLYGFRTPTTLRDEFVWYEANAYFGRGLLWACGIGAAAMLVLFATGNPADPFFPVKSVATIVLPLLVVTIATQRFARSVRRDEIRHRAERLNR